MIKLENLEVVGLEATIRGMRNPMNSWAKSDSGLCKGGDDGIGCKNCGCNKYGDGCDHSYDHSFRIGNNDHDLMMKLVKGGPVHAKFRRMIVVYVDITAPLYFWKEFDTYKVGTVANSCSTMHKIQAKEFTLDDFSNEYLISVGNMNWFDDDINCATAINTGIINKVSDDTYKIPMMPLEILETTIASLNRCRAAFLESGDKRYWWQMVQLLPSSYNQKRTIMMNYEVLSGIYEYRHDHKLDEWRALCEWIKSLPYSELIIQK